MNSIIITLIACVGLNQGCSQDNKIVDREVVILERKGELIQEESNVIEAIVQYNDSLETTYTQLKVLQTEILEDKYFKQFPSTFETFVYYFGDISEIDSTQQYKRGPLSKLSHLYVQLFFSLQTITTAEHIQKSIGIAIDGWWQGDGVNHYNHELNKHFKNNVEKYVNILSSMSDTEINSFWRFYFDGPNPPSKIPESIVSVKDIDERVFRLMKTALIEVQMKWHQ